MLVLFADIPSALTNSVEIAKRCNLEIELGASFYCRIFPIPAGMSAENFLIQEAKQGLVQCLEKRSEVLGLSQVRNTETKLVGMVEKEEVQKPCINVKEFEKIYFERLHSESKVINSWVLRDIF